MNAENRPYSINSLCGDCAAAASSEAEKGACWLRQEADLLIENVKAGALMPIEGKTKLSKLSQKANAKGCRKIQVIRNNSLPEMSEKFKWLSHGQPIHRG